MATFCNDYIVSTMVTVQSGDYSRNLGVYEYEQVDIFK